MKLFVDRFISDKESTVSRIYIDGKLVCFGLEDEYRLYKVKKETRIPEGRYKIKLREYGGHHERYLEKFPSIHKGMLQIMDVPNFTDILIHCGNDDKDTDGCLLVGSEASIQINGMRILNSVVAYKKLYQMVILNAIGDNLEIEFSDNDFPKFEII